MNKLQSFKAYLLYRQAVIRANAAHRKDGHRYFVLPNIDTKILLIVTDRKNFRGLRLKGYIDPNMKMEQVFEKCFYYTAQADGKGKNITEEETKVKQIAFQMWYDARLKKLPAERKARRLQEKEIKKHNKEVMKRYKEKVAEHEKQQELEDKKMARRIENHNKKRNKAR